MAGAAKLSAGKGGAVLEDVPHLTDWLPNLRVSILDRRMVWCTTGSVLLDAVHHYRVPFCNKSVLLLSAMNVWRFSMTIFSTFIKGEV